MSPAKQERVAEERRLVRGWPELLAEINSLDVSIPWPEELLKEVERYVKFLRENVLYG